MRFIARHDGQELAVEVERSGAGYRVKIGERWLEVDLAEAGPLVHSLRLEDGRQFSLVHHRDGNAHEVTLAGTKVHVEIVDPLALKRSRRDDGGGAAGVVKALMPGRIARISVAKGDSVRKGQGLLILEAMKMENEIQAPGDGIVDEIFVTAGDTVEAGAPLVHVAPAPG
jgi:biotin carboxyl carrier protein